MSFAWIKGNDGTEYYVNAANGAVAGMMKDAGNGQQIFKVGFGTDFTKLYHTAGHAKSAVEKLAPAVTERTQKHTTNTKQPVK